MADLDSAAASSNRELDRENVNPNLNAKPDNIKPVEPSEGSLYQGSFEGTNPPEIVDEIPPTDVEADTE